MPSDLLHSSLATPLHALGWIIIGGLVVQVALLVGNSGRRLWFERRRNRLEQRRLALEIREAEMRIERAVQEKSAWNGYRKFTVARRTLEADDTVSFYLAPHDGKPLPPFLPGQYLTFQLAMPGREKPLVRCYSLSDCARPGHYRVTIKRCPPPADSSHPPGACSSHFIDAIKEGDILDAKAPGGNFVLDPGKSRPLVLIGGGVGVTPLMSMLNAIAESGSEREAWFFFGIRHGRDHMFRERLAEISATRKNVHLHVCYSRPLPADVKGRDYHHEGHVSVDLFKELLPSNNYDYYLCGPGRFMESITDGLREWGVPDPWVHFEAFGPASVKRAASPEIKAGLTRAPFAGGFEVTFAKSGRQLLWNGDQASLLELAEAAGVRIEAGCRAGNCGTCLVAIKSGEVEYLGGHGADVESGSCLTCICKPRGQLVLDA